jgi:protein gp37
MTKIEWAKETWNPVTGCTRVSAGCDHCYAVRQTARLGHHERYRGLVSRSVKGDLYFNGVVRCHQDVLQIPFKGRKPTTWFVNSMSDLFHPLVPFEFIYKVFAVAFLCLQHTFLILTKRPKVMAEFLSAKGVGFHISQAIRRLPLPAHMAGVGKGRSYVKMVWGERCTVTGGDPPKGQWPIPNVWLGTSCEDQETADKRTAHLRKCPAAVNFLSLEPLLGPIILELESIDWVIVGSESGPGRRETKLDWVRSIRDQCVAANVPFFLKQLHVNGKKVSMPELDGRVWDQMPEMAGVTKRNEPILDETIDRFKPGESPTVLAALRAAANAFGDPE